MKSKRFLGLNYLLNPLELLRTKKVLKINPTGVAERQFNENIHIHVYHYDASNFESFGTTDIQACLNKAKQNGVTWINIDGLNKDKIEQITETFNIHSLITEDILSLGQRPKLDEIDNHIYVLLNMLYFNTSQSSVDAEQISIVLGKNYVLTFQEDATRDVFNGLREKLKINNSKLRTHNADFLFYTLIDTIVDHYYLVMEALGEKIENLEEDIIRNTNSLSLAKINILRKEMIVLKRNITPVREIISNLLRSDTNLIDEKLEKYLKDIYDHIVQANDVAENYRDMLINLQDLYLNNVNLKMNEVMKVMAIVTCLLAPATVIGGIFGMNFDKIPWLHNNYGFTYATTAMLLIPIIMLIIFKRKKWF